MKSLQVAFDSWCVFYKIKFNTKHQDKDNQLITNVKVSDNIERS